MKKNGGWKLASAALGAWLAASVAVAAPAGDPQALRDRATLQEQAGRYVEAEACVRELLIAGAKDATESERAGDLLALGRILKEEGRLGEADAVFQEAIDALRTKYGVDHPGVAEGLKNLADVRHAEGRDKEAEPLYWRAYMIASFVSGAESSLVGEALFGLALVRQAEKRNAEAHSLLARALHIADKPPRADRKWDRIDERDLRAMHAEEREHVATRGWIMTRSVESSSPEMAEHHERRGEILRALGRLDEARAAFARALEMRRKNFGEAHPEVAYDLWQLSEIDLERGDPGSALELASSAAKVANARIDAFGPGQAQYAAGERRRWQGLFRHLSRLRDLGRRAAIDEATGLPGPR